jgi:hypothetical protein
MFIYEVYMVGHHILRGIYINIESIYTCVYEVYMYEVYMYTYIWGVRLKQCGSSKVVV